MRNSVCHSATIYANALMHAGTTVDTFLKENLDWLSKATNWAKFSTTAGLGVIHGGHLQHGRSLMAPYLPQSGAGGGGGGGSPYSEGGALYALGLIHALYALGLIYLQQGRTVLCSRNGVGEEGQGESYFDGNISFFALSCKELRCRDGGMYALALAYSGTTNNKAIRQLLHFAVSDVSDDVRRTDVLALGFVLYSEPEQGGSSQTALLCCCSPSLSNSSESVSTLRFGARAKHIKASSRVMRSNNKEDIDKKQ
ncbi:unnamed protein product [Lactuca virosa]|uniref:Kinesin motor domain-containing protein n=1 Tax=Lactuca virosa TaxID=75947 RepID=A0AAU9NEG5_9ASTR|nr:unnamed protein product [Lactuca virosa]